MSIFRALFNNHEKPVCPRCMGKGHVTEEDIIRLKRELKWIPGSCAYCNGTGKVNAEILKRVPVDLTYLSTDLTAREALKLLNGNKQALQRAEEHEQYVDSFIAEIQRYNREMDMDKLDIAEHYFKSSPDSFRSEYAKLNMIDYIEKVISHTKY